MKRGVRTLIEVEHLTKRYGSHTAVDDISFTVEDGGIYGLLGPNGAGKSPTMNIITGYISATDGTVKIDGHDIADEPAAAKACIGYLPEIPPLYTDMTVQEYLLFVSELKGKKNKADRVQDVAQAVQRAGLQEMEKRLIRNLSKGYRQRVGLADALLGEPDLLILDEPTNGLDPNQIRQIRELIKGLAANHTIILSTHILSEVEMICNKVIIIDQGTIKAADTPSNLTANLRAAGKITLEFRGDLALITQKLENLEHVKKVIHEGTDADGWHTLTVRAEAGTDTREKAARLLAEQGCPLRHIYRHTPTLEEVFVEMTRKD